MEMHYGDVIMDAMASQIIGVSIIYPTVCLGEDKKHKLKLCVTGLCEGNSPASSPHKGLVTRDFLSSDDVIMEKIAM